MGAPPSVRCKDCFTCSTFIARWASKYLRRAMQVCLAVCLLEKISSSLSSAPWSSGFRISNVLIWKQSVHITVSICYVMIQIWLSSRNVSYFLWMIRMVTFTWLQRGKHDCRFVLPDWRDVGARPACRRAPGRHGRRRRWRRTWWRGSSRTHVSIPAATACNQPHLTGWSGATCTPWEERTHLWIQMCTATRAAKKIPKLPFKRNKRAS